MKNLITRISIWWLEGEGYEVVKPLVNPLTKHEMEVWADICSGAFTKVVNSSK